MKKQSLFVLVVIFILSVVTSAMAADTFTVGLDASFPPYGYYDENGDLTGYDLELAAEVAKRNDWEIIYQPIDWAAKDEELDSGTIDCIWNGFTLSEDRADSYAWTEPYKEAGIVFVVNADSDIETFDDLAGKSIIVQTQSSGEDALNSAENADLAASFASIIPVPDYNTAFMEIESGSGDAIAIDIDVALDTMKAKEGKFRILDQYLNSEVYAVAFKLGNESLRDTVQTTLEEMAADGTAGKISTKWFGEDTFMIGK